MEYVYIYAISTPHQSLNVNKNGDILLIVYNYTISVMLAIVFDPIIFVLLSSGMAYIKFISRNTSLLLENSITQITSWNRSEINELNAKFCMWYLQYPESFDLFCGWRKYEYLCHFIFIYYINQNVLGNILTKT